MIETQLTIVIPTYNRRERLLNQLKSIFKQPEYCQIHIIILDNCSNYDILNELNKNFVEIELSCVEVIQRTYNIGMVGNVSTSFMYCKTKWMWLLSDDDETTDNSLKVLLMNIKENSNIALFKYSIVNFIHEEDKLISNIDELISYYISGKHSSGGLIFMSNNVFNMELLNPYLGYANVYSYTYIPHLIPVIAGLANKKIKIKFCSERIVKYIAPDINSKWSFLPVLLGVSSFVDIDFGLKKEQQRLLCTLIARNFPQTMFISALLNINDRWKRKIIYNKVFNSLYKFKDQNCWFFYFIFYFIHYSRIDMVFNVVEFGKKIEKKIKKR